jgi:hypothetical protein
MDESSATGKSPRNSMPEFGFKTESDTEEKENPSSK